MYYQNSGYYYLDLPNSLSDEDIEKNFKLARNGDKDAEKKLKESNLRIVAFVIKKYFINLSNNRNFDMDDIFSIGTIGLMKAINTFDINKIINFQHMLLLV